MSNSSEATMVSSMPDNLSVDCISLKKSYVLGLAVFPGFAAIENVVFLLAIALYRRKLKTKNVYRYVASAFTANVVISILAFYHFLNYYFGFEPEVPNLWWAFRKGMQLALSLVLCGNIGLLIYGIRESTYVVSRNMIPCPQSEKLSPRYRRRKANYLILLVWALPTVYGCLAMTSWNCTTGQCTCTLRYESGMPICSEEPCSQLYTPMAKSYLLLVVVLWALECLGLFVLICKSIVALKHSNKKMNVTLCQLLRDFTANSGVICLLFVLFLLCTAPVMILFALDFAIPQVSFSHILSNVLIPLPLLYCIASPLLLAHKLSGVKRALTMGWRCPCSNRAAKKKANKQKKLAAPRPTSISITDYPKSTEV